MAEPVEVAIEYALLQRATEFAASQSPAVTISLPNIAFAPPFPGPSAKWLRATFLPADTITLGVSLTSSNQHLGLLQIDVFWGVGGGELNAARLASSVIQYFKRGTTVTKDGFKAHICLAPFRGPIIRDDGWTMIPVRIPYLCFAPNPA